MIKFAFMKVGIGSSSVNRNSFFTAVKFNVGGNLYRWVFLSAFFFLSNSITATPLSFLTFLFLSRFVIFILSCSFQDLENGILRGNRRAPYALSKPISSSKSEPRYAFVLKSEEVDERIHFALNCGAKSCPPVKSFTSEGIEEELRIVAQAFAEEDDNCRVDVDNHKLYLNKILYWYMADFAETEQDLPTKVLEYLRGDKKVKLQAMMSGESAKPIAVKFNEYDWGTNASDFQEFDAANLPAQYYSITALSPW